MPVQSTDLVMVQRGSALHRVTAEEIAALNTESGGPNVTVGTTPPANPQIGDFWVDTN